MTRTFTRIARSPQMPRYRALLQPDAQKVLWGRSHQALSDLFAPERKDPEEKKPTTTTANP